MFHLYLRYNKRNHVCIYILLWLCVPYRLCLRFKRRNQSIGHYIFFPQFSDWRHDIQHDDTQRGGLYCDPQHTNTEIFLLLSCVLMSCVVILSVLVQCMVILSVNIFSAITVGVVMLKVVAPWDCLECVLDRRQQIQKNTKIIYKTQKKLYTHTHTHARMHPPQPHTHTHAPSPPTHTYMPIT